MLRREVSWDLMFSILDETGLRKVCAVVCAERVGCALLAEWSCMLRLRGVDGEQDAGRGRSKDTSRRKEKRKRKKRGEKQVQAELRC